ncbi:MAG: SufS family cysteine desulfurase [bacterium]
MNKYKNDFTLFKENPKLVYLDSAASSLKPDVVIDKVENYNRSIGVNVHRGVYNLSYQATDLYERARTNVSKFINSKFNEIVFTRGCSSALNLVASSYGEANIKENDEIIVSELEHHSNLIPWQKLCERKNAKLIYVPLTQEGKITVDNFKSVLTDNTKIVALNHVSNVMGYETPVKEIITLSHEKNAIVVIDGAQATPHMNVDVKELDCDFYAFSGHKMCAPTGIGVLYGKYKLLQGMDPIEFGGDMADVVTTTTTTYKDAPYKFEAGTPIIAGAIGLGEACVYLKNIGLDKIKEHEIKLATLCLKELENVEGVSVYNKNSNSGIITFNVDNVHPHDAASVFDKNNVCLRAGHHCAQPITTFLKQLSTLRISFYFYNTEEDVKVFIDSVKEVVEFFGKF